MNKDIKVVVFDIYGVVVDKEGNLNEEVINILKDLKKKSIKLLLCSNSSRKMIEIWDSKYDFLKYFDDMVLAETIKANKPEPEIFKAIIEMNPDVEPHNILFVDDKEENILASEAEGLTGKRYRPGLVDL